MFCVTNDDDNGCYLSKQSAAWSWSIEWPGVFYFLCIWLISSPLHWIGTEAKIEEDNAHHAHNGSEAKLETNKPLILIIFACLYKIMHFSSQKTTNSFLRTACIKLGSKDKGG